MRPLIAVLLLGGLAASAAARGPPNDLCGDCKTVVRVFKDAMCDPGLEGTVVDWLVDNVCPATGSKQSCSDVVNGVAPALFDWLRLGTDDGEMCAQVGVCGAPPVALLAHSKAAANRARLVAAGANDMTCPLCMFVVTKVKDGLADPTTREAIHARTTAACALMPEGAMRDACSQWANKYEESIFNFVDTTEPAELCAMLGSCSIAARLAALPPPALSRELVAALAPLARASAAAQAAANGAVPNDNCETCKVVVAEMHSALANPSLQQQITDYAKAICDSTGSYAESCKEHVDQYAPLAFGTVLAYLQPDQVCKQLHMCPAPSALERLLGLTSSLAADKFLLLGGRPLVRIAAPVA